MKSASQPDRTTILRPVISLPLTDESGGEKKSRKLIINPEPRTDNGPATATVPPQEDGRLKDDLGATLSRQFGPYEILGEISRGSFGVVYRARQQGLDRIVALKVLLAGVHASGEAVERFKREAKAVARLKHPNIVPVYDIGTHDGHHYFAMEFVEGDSLANLIAVRFTSISDSLAIAESLADALETAHHASIIHRDIKPSNILIDKKGKPHITDFGLAKQVDLDTKYTLSGTTLGTPAYMPPEQARGEIDRIDARSDVYAIGAVLYEMLTGRTPFAGRSVLEVVVAVINEPVRPPRQLNPKIHRDVQTIVMKCLEKDPRLRYDSAAELRDDLRRFRSGETIRARPAGIVRITGRVIKRHYVLMASAVMVATAFGFSLKAKQDQVQANVETEKMRRQLMVKASNEAVWRPDWWFPPKTAAELQNEETQKFYTVPEGKEGLFQQFVKGKDPWDIHLEKVKGRDGQPDIWIEKTSRHQPGNSLVSPEEFRFYGDVDANVEFNLSDAFFAPTTDPLKAPRVRIGLQSMGSFKGYDGIPYVAEFGAGSVRVIGPVDLYGHTSPSEGEKRGPPRLEVKAEKQAPNLVPGQYTLNLHREGTALQFRLVGPAPFPGVSIEVKDPNLSNWVFRNTQLTVRDPNPGVQILSAEVRRKYGDDDDPSFRFFRVGDYNVAEAELKVTASGQDAFKRARAKYQLGLIQEICVPAAGRELTWYTDALNDLDEMPPDDPRLRERGKLASEIHHRKMIRFAKIKQWNGVIDELNEAWNGASVGEPLAWELHGVLEMLLREKEPDAGVKMMAALTIFQRLGIEPGSQKFGRWAEELAGLLNAERRFDDLIALHKAFPTPMLTDEFFAAARKALEKNQFDVAMQMIAYITPFCRTEKELKLAAEAGCDYVAAAMKTKHFQEATRMFASMPSLPALKALCQEIEIQAKELADDDFYSFLTKVLQPVMASMPQDQAATKLIDASLDKLCKEIIAAGRVTKLQKLHETVRGPKALMDSRLSESFARAVLQLSQNGDAGSYSQALSLLKYCSAHVTQSDTEIRRAAYSLAKPKAKVDENRSYFAILTIQDAYPTPELLNLSRDVMLELNHPQKQRYEEAVMFFSQARVDFGTDARALTPLALGALEKVRSPDQRSQLMNSIWLTVNGQYEQQHTAAAERLFEQQQIGAAARQWRLEYGDMELTLNLWDRARETYLSLLDTRPTIWSLKMIEPELRARASLRLGVLGMARAGRGNPNDYLLPLLTTENTQDEYKLAARFLGTPDQIPISDLEAQLKQLRAPLLLSESEWDLIRGLRLRQEGSTVAAATAFRVAESKSSSARSWVLTVASYLGRPVARSPEEELKMEEVKKAEPRTVPAPK